MNPIVCHRCQRHRQQIFRRFRWYRWQFATGVVDTGGKFVDTGGKFATGINNTSETGGKICRRCRWYRWKICHRRRWYQWSTLSYEYLREFSKKFETALMVYWGAWGKLIHQKNQKQKISWHCPFNATITRFSLIFRAVHVSGRGNHGVRTGSTWVHGELGELNFASSFAEPPFFARWTRSDKPVICIAEMFAINIRKKLTFE